MACSLSNFCKGTWLHGGLWRAEVGFNTTLRADFAFFQSGPLRELGDAWCSARSGPGQSQHQNMRTLYLRDPRISRWQPHIWMSCHVFLWTFGTLDQGYVLAITPCGQDSWYPRPVSAISITWTLSNLP